MNDAEREAALRRLLADAVEPLEPAAGSQARLEARIHQAEVQAQAEQRRSKKSETQKSRWRRLSPAGLHWSGAGVSAVAAGVVVVAAAVFFATHASRTGDSAASSAGSPASAPSAASAATQGASAGSSSHAPAKEPAPELASPAAANDLDGDGIADVFTLNGDTLSAQLSQSGEQQVTLPPTGAGARVLGVTDLQSVAGSPVQVVFVRLLGRAGFAQDAVAALLDGRLTVLRFGAQPAVLTVDSTAG
jgi:hypothetical protein